MSDESAIQNMSRVFHALASVAIPDDAAGQKIFRSVAKRALAVALDFAYHEPSYFAAMARHGSQGAQEGAEGAEIMWRELVTMFPLPREEPETRLEKE